MTTAVKQKASRAELASLAGNLDFLKGLVDIERKVRGKHSYDTFSQTVEDSINTCCDIADRLLYAGLEGIE